QQKHDLLNQQTTNETPDTYDHAALDRDARALRLDRLVYYLLNDRADLNLDRDNRYL
ncbi:unnamed protein product, partial [Rotaria sordida]